MDLYTLLSSHKEVTGHFTYALALFVAFGALRVYKDKALNPKEQFHLNLLCFGLLIAAFTFLKPVWGFWSGLLSACLFLWAYALTSLSRPRTIRGLKQVALVSIVVAGLGMLSGFSPSLSMGPSMWPQTPKHLSLGLLNTNAYRHMPPTYGDDVEFSAQDIPSLDPSSLSPWGGGNFRKRVWALEGDRIQITPSSISINDRLVADCSHPAASDFIAKTPSPVFFCHARFPNGKTQRFVWGDINAALYPVMNIKVDKGEIFVMGDNTVESGDSREHGPILASWVLGRFRATPTSQKWHAW